MGRGWEVGVSTRNTAAAMAALVGAAAPEPFWELCRAELSCVDAAIGGWDIPLAGSVWSSAPRLDSASSTAPSPSPGASSPRSNPCVLTAVMALDPQQNGHGR